jgi:hypothetical protein
MIINCCSLQALPSNKIVSLHAKRKIAVTGGGNTKRYESLAETRKERERERERQKI